MSRERLGSRLGFILLSAGCAIGVGNVWKFPYMAGQNGGGIFVILYFLFLIVLGIPVMTMEFALGRASQKSPAKMFDQLQPTGSKWHIHGKVALAGNYLLMMFYTVVCGWIVKYFCSSVTGDYAGLDSKGVADYFASVQADAFTQIIFTVFVILIGFLVCSFSLQKGLERVTKFMMIALLAIIIVLAINSILLEGGTEGLKFYLLPSVEKINELGIGNIIVASMTQAFFTLSLGIGSMAIFGSYIGKDRALLGESLNIAVLDTFVAVSSGLIIFPACSAYDIPTDSGPSLIFITLPQIFNNLPGGRVWGSLFFVFMMFAAFSTVLAVFENIISCTMDLFGFSRRKACFVNCIAMFILAMPCALGFNILSGITPFGEGSCVLDLEDFIVSNLLLPIGSLIVLLFCTTKFGWGWDNFVKEANTGKGLKIKNWMRGYLTYILPIIILILFVMGIYNFFA